MPGDEEGRQKRQDSRISSMETLLKEMKEQIGKIAKSVNKIEEKLTSQNKKIEMIETNMQEWVQIKKEFLELKAENRYLKDKMKSIEQSAEKAQIEQKRNQLEIHGLPKDEGESPEAAVRNLANAAKIKIGNGEITECYRLKDRENRDGIIIVKLKEATNRDKLMKELKLAKPTLELINKEPRQRKIFINEVLIPVKKFLFYKTRQAARDKG